LQTPPQAIKRDRAESDPYGPPKRDTLVRDIGIPRP